MPQKETRIKSIQHFWLQSKTINETICRFACGTIPPRRSFAPMDVGYWPPQMEWQWRGRRTWSTRRLRQLMRYINRSCKGLKELIVSLGFQPPWPWRSFMVHQQTRWLKWLGKKEICFNSRTQNRKMVLTPTRWSCRDYITTVPSSQVEKSNYTELKNVTLNGWLESTENKPQIAHIIQQYPGTYL